MAPDLDEDRLLPVGDLAQLADLDLEVVRTGPVGMAAGAALVDALGQVAHLGDAVGDLLAEQHAAAARLGALADHDLDRVGPAQVVRVHAVARRQQLVDEQLGVLALLGRHAAVAGRRARADRARAAAERLLGGRRQRAEAHAGDRDRDVELERLRRRGGRRARRRCRSARGSPRAGSATCSRRGRARSSKCGTRALGAEAADVVDALARGALDLVRSCGGRRGRTRAGLVARPSVLPGVVDVEVVEPAGRAVAAELGRRRGRRRRRARAARRARRGARRASPSRRSRRRARRPSPRTYRRAS